jgi:VWFA-related protein
MLTLRKPSLCVCAIAFLACSILVLAAPNEKKGGNSEVKFTSRTELVLIPTLVTDKSGAHISGLKKEDFTVRENGVVHEITAFEEITSDAHRWSRPRDPGVFTNSMTGGETAGRITLIVLDFINTPFMDQASERKELLKYLTQSVDEREPTALYTLTRSGIHVIHDFTTDPRILAAALHKANGDPFQMVDTQEDVEALTGTANPDGGPDAGPGSDKSKNRESEAAAANQGISALVQSEAGKIQTMMEDHALNFKSFQQRLAITYTLQGMQQIAQALAGLPDRKSLIWASGGFPFSVSDNTMRLAPAGRDSLVDVLPMYEHTWQLLNAAQIALYPVDVRGLRAATLPGASVGNPGKSYARNTASRQVETQTTFQTFASMTGGRAYYNSNDLVKGFLEAVSDSAEYYMLGYYLDRSNTKPGWRKLAVKVQRDHAEVRARGGFFVTNATIDPDTSRNNDVASALQSPLDYTSLAVVMRWENIEPGKVPGKKHVNYRLHVAADPALINDVGKNHVDLEFVALAKTPEGKPVGRAVSDKIDTHLTSTKVSAIREKGMIAYAGTLDLAAGEYSVRFVVRDDLSGRMGSVAAPLKVE